MGKKKHFYTGVGNVNSCNRYGKQYRGPSKELKIITTSDTTPAHISRGMCSNTRQSHLYAHVHCSTIYNRQALETDRYPRTDEWIKKTWCIYTMEFYSATKKNEIMLLADKWNWRTSC
jgi:hypothetical protein